MKRILLLTVMLEFGILGHASDLKIRSIAKDVDPVLDAQQVADILRKLQ